MVFQGLEGPQSIRKVVIIVTLFERKLHTAENMDANPKKL